MAGSYSAAFEKEDAEDRLGALSEEISAVVEEGVRSIRETAAEELKGIEKP
jgi:hypothetical protein